jgi:hypothetical protein
MIVLFFKLKINELAIKDNEIFLQCSRIIIKLIRNNLIFYTFKLYDLITFITKKKITLICFFFKELYDFFLYFSSYLDHMIWTIARLLKS